MSFPQTQLSDSLKTYLRSPGFRQSCSILPPGDAERALRYGAPLGSLIEVHESLPRCMERLREMIGRGYADGPLPSGTVVIAGRLSAGSGRFDRQWHAPAGGLWLAVAWADTLLPEYTGLLPLAAGIAGCEAARRFGADAAVKWVNDIHINGRKIGGILCETVTGGQGDRYHLAGIGINCNNTTFPPELEQSATSLRNELGAAIDLETFTLELLARLAWNFGLVHLYEERTLAWQRDGRPGFPVNPVTESWKRLSDTLGRRVEYGYDVVQKPMYRAFATAIDANGGLVLELANGATVTENSGEIVYLD